MHYCNRIVLQLFVLTRFARLSRGPRWRSCGVLLESSRSLFRKQKMCVSYIRHKKQNKSQAKEKEFNTIPKLGSIQQKGMHDW